jgi:hypothetical protein
MTVHKDEGAANVHDTLKQGHNKWEPAIVRQNNPDLLMALHRDEYVKEAGV